MVNKILIFIAIFLTAIQIVFADNSILIKDKESDLAMSGVIVHFISIEGPSKDSIAIRISNEKGIAINPFNGLTQLLLSHVGYETISDTLKSGRNLFYMFQKSILFDDIVVTGQFSPISSQKSVFNIKVIDQAKIKSQGANNLRELLLTEANIRISQDNILGSKININGISGENIKIMIDGVPIIGRLDGNIDISQVNLNNIQRVEIVEGPMSSIYGSDALGGVINLITKELDCKRFEFEGGTYLESVGVYNFDGLFRYSLEDIRFMLNGGRNFFQGFDPVSNSRNLKWNPKEQYYVDFQTKYSLIEHEISYSFKYFNEFILNRGTLRPPYFETAFDDKYRTSRITNSVFYKGKIGESYFLHLTGAYSYYNRKKNTFFKDMLTLNEKLTESPSDQDTSVFDLYMLRGIFSDDKLLNNLKYQVGFEINVDVAEGKKIESGIKDMSDIAVFGSIQYIPFNFLTIQPSIRVIENSKYDAPLVPAINIKTDITDYLTLRASYAKGFRSPSIKELYFQFVDINHNIFGNKDLIAEKSDSYNASLLFREQVDIGYLTIEPKFFYNKIFDMITLALMEDGIYKNVNIGNYETIGSNLSIKLFRKEMSINAVFSYIGRLNSIFNETGTRKYNFAPEFSLSADYLISPLKTNINLYYKYTGIMPAFTIVKNAPVEYRIEDFQMLDVSLSRELFDMINVVAGVKNLFNVVDISSTMSESTGVHSSGSTYPMGWGRTFFIGLNFKVN